jgi:hypothetical protein
LYSVLPRQIEGAVGLVIDLPAASRSEVADKGGREEIYSSIE